MHELVDTVAAVPFRPERQGTVKDVRTKGKMTFVLVAWSGAATTWHRVYGVEEGVTRVYADTTAPGVLPAA